MNDASILSKSGKGMLEVSGKTSILSRGDRAVLAQVDGKTTVAELNKKFEKIEPPKFLQLMEQLSKDGFAREVSSGATAPAPTPAVPKAPAKPAAPPPADNDSDEALDFTQMAAAPKKSAAPAAPKPPVDLAAQVRAASEKTAQEDPLNFKARQEAESKVALAAQRAKVEAEVRADATAAAKAKAGAESRAREEMQAKVAAAEAAQAKAEAEAKVRAEAETKARAEAEVRAAAEEKAKAQAADKARRDAEDNARVEADLKAEHEREVARAEAERVAREVASRKEGEEKARRENEEAEARAKKEAEEKAAREAEEKARREKEEAEARAKREAEEKARKEKEEAEARAKKDAEEKAAREAAEKARKEKEESEARAKREAEEKATREAEDKARKEKEAEVAAAAAATPAPAASATDSLLADLDSFSMREDEEREQKEAEEKVRKAAEDKARAEAEARAKMAAEEEAAREAGEISRKEEKARLTREAEERKAVEAEDSRKAEEADRKRKAAESMARHKTDAGAAPKPAGPKKPGPDGEDDIDISDDDLDLDDVKADEKKLSKGDKKDDSKDQRARDKIDSAALKASKAADSVILVPQGPVKYRKPVKWGKPVAITLFVLLLAGLGLIHVMPLSTSNYERLASEALGRPVKIGSVNLSVITGVELRILGVAIGDTVRIGSVRATPQLGSLFAEKKAFTNIEIEGLVLPQDELAGALLGSLKSDGLSIAHITAAKAKFTGPLALPDLDLDIALGQGGGVQSVGLKSAEAKLTGRIQPQAGGASVELNAGSLSLPFAPGLAISDFAMKGTATAGELSLSAWDGKIFDGIASGTARIRWGARWVVDGELRVKQMNAGVLAPALMSDGKADARGTFSMSGTVPDKLGADARIEGSFSVAKGVLGSFDLARALQPTASQATGRTLFSELSGAGVYSKGAVQLRDMKLTAGLLTASGTMDIDASGRVSGQVSAQLGPQRGSISLSGTAKEPKIGK